jgi:DNA invertase Pin-like site-specific DNA recombinase
MAVFGYILSPPETHKIDDEMSLDEQRERIAAHALEQGWELTEIFVDDVVSSSRPFAQRPAGGQLYARLRRGDIIIAARLDRCLRSAAAALELIGELRARGVSLWLLDLGGDISGDGLAHLALTMFGAVAEVERGGIRERILDAKERQRRAGRFLGGLRPPFGWRLNRDGKTITEDPAEQAALATMRQIRAEGASFPAIARKVREAHGIEMPARVIWRLLNRRPAKQSE